MPSPPRFADLCLDLLRAGTPVRFTAVGPSMWPTIRDGDVVTVEPVSPGEVAVGDVVLYRSERGLTAHRIVRRGGGWSAARGDAPGSEEEVVADEQLFGRVTTAERPGGRFRAITGLRRRLLDALSPNRPAPSRSSEGAKPQVAGATEDEPPGAPARPLLRGAGQPCACGLSPDGPAE